MIARLVTLLASATLVTACQAQAYAIRVTNESSQKLSEVTVWYGNLATEFGYLGASVYKVRDLIRHPPPATADVSWLDASAQPHRVAVDLSNVVPERYDGGVLAFSIHDDGTVTAGFFIPQELPFELPDG